MSYLNEDIVNAVNPYISDMGVGLVFGLGYYVIKYIYCDQKDETKQQNDKTINKVCWDEAKTIEEFNDLIKSNENSNKLNPFEILVKMNQKSLSADITTYNNLLNSCYVSRNFENAEKLAEEMFDFTSPVQADISSFNILLKGISIKLDSAETEEEKKSLVDAQEKLFKDLFNHQGGLEPNDVTINTILDILIKGGQYKQAWDLFDSMEKTYNVSPDKYSYSTIIKALKFDLDANKLERAFGILEYLKSQNTKLHDEIIFNCLIDVCFKLNSVDKAEKVFSEMREVGVSPSKITYAIMIKGYGQIYNLEASFKIFEQMKENNIEANEIIYGCLLQACVRSSNITKLTFVYNEMKANNIQMNVVIYTTLIKAFTKAKNLNSAFDVYNTMLQDSKVNVNIIAHNAMLDSCVECSEFNRMNQIYEQIKEKYLSDENQPQPDLITYSTVIKGYAKEKNMDKVFDIYNFLKSGKDYKLDEVIFNSILDGCAKTHSFDKAIQIYTDMQELGITRSNVTYSILVKLYSNNKMEEKALRVLDEMKVAGIKPGVIVYTCLIQTCFRTKRFNQAISLFEEMKHSGIKPDHVLYNTVVNGGLHHQQ